MGGPDSPGYARFQTLACEAYNILRKSAPLFLSMARLMAQAGIPDLSGGAPRKAHRYKSVTILVLTPRHLRCADPEKTMAKLEDKFALGLDDGASLLWQQPLFFRLPGSYSHACSRQARRCSTLRRCWRRVRGRCSSR
jgi:hypothetical protein